MYCPNCGKQLPDNAIFCSACGSRIGFTVQAPQNAQSPRPAPVQNPQSDASGVDAMKRYLLNWRALFWMVGGTAAGLLIGAAEGSMYAGLFISMYFLIPFGIFFLKSLYHTNKTIQEFAARGELSAAVADFTQARPMAGNRIRLGNRYLFVKRKGWAYRYDQIYCLYRFTYSCMFIPIYAIVRLGDTEGNLRNLLFTGYFNKKLIGELAEALYPKNPGIIFGYKPGLESNIRKMAKEAKKAKRYN